MYLLYEEEEEGCTVSILVQFNFPIRNMFVGLRRQQFLVVGRTCSPCVALKTVFLADRFLLLGISIMTVRMMMTVDLELYSFHYIQLGGYYRQVLRPGNKECISLMFLVINGYYAHAWRSFKNAAPQQQFSADQNVMKARNEIGNKCDYIQRIGLLLSML